MLGSKSNGNSTDTEPVTPPLHSNKRTISKYYKKCIARTRKTPKKVIVPLSEGTRNTSLWKKLSSRVVRRKQRTIRGIGQQSQPIKHINHSQHEASLTDYTEATNQEEQFKTEEFRELNNDKKHHMPLSKRHTQQSNAKSKMFDNQAITLTNLNISNTRQSSKKAFNEDIIIHTSDMRDLTYSIHQPVLSNELNCTSHRNGLLPFHNGGKPEKEMAVSSRNENDNNIYPTTETRFTDNSAKRDGPEALHEHTQHLNLQTAPGDTPNLVGRPESDLDKEQFVTELRSLINVAPTTRADKHYLQSEDSLTVSIEATDQEYKSNTKLNVCEETSVISAEIDTRNTEYSFEIALDSVSLAQSDLNDEDTFDESCATEENLLINIASNFSFDEILGTINIFNNGTKTSSDVTSVEISDHWFSVIVDEYLDTDAKLSMALTSNRKKGLAQKRRAVLHKRRRARTIAAILISACSLIYTYILLGQCMMHSQATLHGSGSGHIVKHCKKKLSCQLINTGTL